ncbi:MAG: glycosyltransferase [Bacteroidales bacterium]|nr:glycosyltransferase [Bacteroidales bacterium]MBP5758556.1 glycosyltransferase [Bacteroidales bacterium]
MSSTPFSVLMSVYRKENPEFLRQALDSVFDQTAVPAEVVLVEDGPLTDELYALLDDYGNSHPELKRVPLSENRGLGLALQEGINHCSNELVARMDTDDISVPTRFERQLAEFEKNPGIDICGSHIKEFEETPDHIVAERRVPLTHDDCKRYQRRRDAFNHVSVMFRKTAVLKAGNYQHCPLMEDTLLWANMFKTGATAMNIDDYLVLVRIGKDMYERRGGMAYFKKYRKARRVIYQTGFISWWDYAYTIVIQFVVAIMPNSLRGFVFKKLLHKQS